MPTGVRAVRVEPYANSVWTAQDEQQFVEMQQRRERVTEKRLASLQRALEGVPLVSVSSVVDYAIAHAGLIRDALEPYDDGVRQVHMADPA